MAVYRKDLLNAFHDQEWVAFVQFAELVEAVDDPDGLGECFLIIEDNFLFESDEFTRGVFDRCIDFYRLQLITEFKPAM